MTGRDHLIAGTAVLVTYLVSEGAKIGMIASENQPAGTDIPEYAWYPMSVRTAGWVPLILYSFVLLFLFWFGLLLPDCDSRGSIIGKVFYLPIKHRTWTHTLWIVFGLLALSAKFIWLKPLALGYFLHLLADSVSAAGICWFYPIDRYITYPNGAFVAKGHKIKLYHTGQKSETVVLVIICCICALIFCYFGILKHGLVSWFLHLVA